MEYIPLKGFYDLRDYKLPKKIFNKLYTIQRMLYEYTNNQKYHKKYNKIQYEKAKEVSACYQQILFSYLKKKEDKQMYFKED